MHAPARWLAALTALGCGSGFSGSPALPKARSEHDRDAVGPIVKASHPGRIEVTALRTCHDGLGLKVRFAMQNLSRTAVVSVSPIDQRSQCSFEKGRLACFTVPIFDTAFDPSGGDPNEPCGIRDGWWWQPGQTMIETKRFEGFPSTDELMLDLKLSTVGSDCKAGPGFEGKVLVAVSSEECPAQDPFECWDADQIEDVVLDVPWFIGLGDRVVLMLTNCGAEPVQLPAFDRWKVGVCLTESEQWTGLCKRTELHVDSTCSGDLVTLAPGEQRELQVTLRRLVARPRSGFRPHTLSVSLLAPVHSMRCDVVGWARHQFTRILTKPEFADVMR